MHLAESFGYYSVKTVLATFTRVSEKRVAFGDENLGFFFLFFFLQLFYKYLAAEFFTGINSK